jgi:hypothetical protein
MLDVYEIAEKMRPRYGLLVFTGCLLISLAAEANRVRAYHFLQFLDRGAKIVNVVGHCVATVLYYRARDYIDQSYTSYTSGNEFGYSNIEKAQFRAENKRIARILITRGAVAWLLWYAMSTVAGDSLSFYSIFSSVPLWLSSLMGLHTMCDNFIYVKQVWYPGSKKEPYGKLPRSPSGRLI